LGLPCHELLLLYLLGGHFRWRNRCGKSRKSYFQWGATTPWAGELSAAQKSNLGNASLLYFYTVVALPPPLTATTTFAKVLVPI